MIAVRVAALELVVVAGDAVFGAFLGVGRADVADDRLNTHMSRLQQLSRGQLGSRVPSLGPFDG